ncbi:MAG: putative sporulation protein YtxC [Bacillota bacterium]|nr:putative sporulation protein YtxC [Bacillota bacterium]MDW7684966.1 putative sporulation protein YtxC [Bacillota bacterium]
MAKIAIAVKHATPGLKVRLEEGMLYFREAGYEIGVEEEKVDRLVHFVCVLSKKGAAPDRETAGLFRRFLAESLTSFILQEQIAPYLDELLSHYYFYFPRPERREILSFAQRNYADRQEKNAGGQVYSEVQNSLRDFLFENSYINLHGFIVFRLRFWLELLRKSLDKAVDDFLMEKEYQEFIKLLKYFVALQEPKINQVHVTLDEDGHIQLLNQEYKALEHVEQGIEWDGADGSSDEEDQLVSLLITVAPYRVVLHKRVFTMFPKAADTLKHVFENRVTLCKQCKLCQNMNKHVTHKGK